MNENGQEWGESGEILTEVVHNGRILVKYGRKWNKINRLKSKIGQQMVQRGKLATTSVGLV